MTLSYRLLILSLAMSATAALVLGVTEMPGLLANVFGPGIEAWLRSLTPMEMRLLRGALFALPLFSSMPAAIAVVIRQARAPKPPVEPRWSPVKRTDPFHTRSGHGA